MTLPLSPRYAPGEKIKSYTEFLLLDRESSFGQLLLSMASVLTGCGLMVTMLK